MPLLYGLLTPYKMSIKLKCYKGELLDLSSIGTKGIQVHVTRLLTTLGWPSLETRRSYLKVILTYKILKNLITTPSNNFRPVNYNTRGHQHHFQHLQCTSDSYKYSFFPSAIRLWNSLPLNIASYM